MLLKPKTPFLEQNTKEIKEDIGVVTLNISNLLNAVIPRKKFMDNSFNAKIVWNWRLQN